MRNGDILGILLSSLSDLISINEKIQRNGEIISFKLLTFQYLKLRKKCIHK